MNVSPRYKPWAGIRELLRTQRLRSVLVVAQIAISLVILSFNPGLQGYDGYADNRMNGPPAEPNKIRVIFETIAVLQK